MDQIRLKNYIAANPNAKLRDVVTQLLYDDIVELRIVPGSKLNVNQIAANLGISRTPVAEAIGMLSEYGFVVTHPGMSGSYVLDLNLNDMISLYRVRSAIECEAAAQCAHNCSESTVHELEELAVAFKESIIHRDSNAMKDTDMPFHKLIISSCGNPYIEQCYRQIMPKLTMYQGKMTEIVVRSGSDNPWMNSLMYNHIAVASAIRLRMPELARQSMADHVDTSLSFTTFSGNGQDPFLILTGK